MRSPRGPIAAGLGSSAAATVAGLRVFERVTGAVADSVLLGAATEVEGHADNAAPALFGGLNSVLDVKGVDPLALRWAWPDDLCLVVATPAVGLATPKARGVLPNRCACGRVQPATSVGRSFMRCTP